MTESFTPLVTATQLGVYLDDDTIDTTRANLLLQQAQLLCQTVVSPLPAVAPVVIMRVAGRAYVTITQSRAVSAPIGVDTPFGYGTTGTGAVRLEDEDESDLRRSAGSGGAFSIDMLPTGYTAPVSLYGYDWDQIA